MSSATDSQNELEQNVDLSEGSSPNESYYEGIRSSPDLPKATTRTKNKRTSDDEDEALVASEATSKKKTVSRKEYGTSASTGPSAKERTAVRRIPMSKAHKSSAPKETMIFTGEEPSNAEGDAKNKNRGSGRQWLE